MVHQGRTMTAATQSDMTADQALQILVDGNKRFVEGTPSQRDLHEQVRITSKGQYPLAVVQGCIDSRVPLETVFDCGVGDIFGSRVAGNVFNEDQIAGMEYACCVAGSRLVMVLGHTRCGAVTSALKGVELGNITALLAKIGPARESLGAYDEVTPELVDRAVEAQVRDGVGRIRAESPLLADLEKDGKIRIVGAVYDVATGHVKLLPS